MKKRVCIIIPIYKKKPDKYDRFCVDRTILKLSCYDIFFLTYPELNLEEYRKYSEIKTVYFPKRYFKNTITYSKLLLKKSFYISFADYEYMLIVQTDALVLGEAEQLELFMDKGFDYWGARWVEPVEICSFEIEKNLKKELLRYLPECIAKRLFKNPKFCYVGNGGFSLRNIRKTIALLDENRLNAKMWLDNEDKFFAYFGQNNHVNFKVAPKNMVDSFSLESAIKNSLDTINPFGLHAWRKKGRFQVLNYLNKNDM